MSTARLFSIPGGALVQPDLRERLVALRRDLEQLLTYVVFTGWQLASP